MGLLSTMGINPFLHLFYSDQHLLETAQQTDIVKTFNELYPESKVRYVTALDQQPAIVFEMVQDQKMAFLAVGNFEGENLTFMYRCTSFDSTFFESDLSFTSQQIRDNPCFT